MANFPFPGSAFLASTAAFSLPPIMTNSSLKCSKRGIVTREWRVLLNRRLFLRSADLIRHFSQIGNLTSRAASGPRLSNVRSIADCVSPETMLRLHENHLWCECARSHPRPRQSGDPVPPTNSFSADRLVARRDAGLFSNRLAASSRARSCSFSGPTTSLARPSRNASSAVIMRPVSSRSRACFSPTWRSRKVDTIAGTNPIRTSV